MTAPPTPRPRLDPEPAALSARAWRGAVLMLHGGADSGLRPVDRRSLSRWRVARMRDRIAPRLEADGLVTILLRYRVKGWNAGREPEPMPVSDARWALTELHRAHPRLPLVLLGHSMGARAAVHVAGHPSVAGVVALAPWLPPGEPVAGLGSRPLLAAHGRRDRITSRRATLAYLAQAEATGSAVSFTDMGDVGHYLLRREARWDGVAVHGCTRLIDAVSRRP